MEIFITYAYRTITIIMLMAIYNVVKEIEESIK